MDNVFAIDAEWKVSSLTCSQQVNCAVDVPCLFSRDCHDDKRSMLICMLLPAAARHRRGRGQPHRTAAGVQAKYCNMRSSTCFVDLAALDRAPAV